MIRLPKIGDYVEVWWDGDERSYRGHLVKKRGRVHPFRFDIDYDDGDKQTHDLNEERWCFVETPDKWYDYGDVEELKRELSERPFLAATKVTHRLKAGSKGACIRKRMANRQAGVEAVKRLKLLCKDDAPKEMTVVADDDQPVIGKHSEVSRQLQHDNEMTFGSNLQQPWSSSHTHDVAVLELDDEHTLAAMSAKVQKSNFSPLSESPTPPPPPPISKLRPCLPAPEVDNSMTSTLDSASEGSKTKLENHLPQRKRLLARYYGNKDVTK